MAIGSTRSPRCASLLPPILGDLNHIVDNWDQFSYNGGAAAQKPGHLQRVGSLGGALQGTTYTGHRLLGATRPPHGPVRTGLSVGQELETEL